MRGYYVIPMKNTLKAVLTVAEYGEFHDLGEYKETESVTESVTLFKQYLEKGTCGVPTIGIRVYPKGRQGTIEDVHTDIVTYGTIDYSMLEYIPSILRCSKAVHMLQDLRTVFPKYDVIGNYPIPIKEGGK